MTFIVGMRVRLSPSAKEYYQDSGDNPHNESGFIREHLGIDNVGSWVYYVVWDGGGSEWYRKFDLVHNEDFTNKLLEDYL